MRKLNIKFNAFTVLYLIGFLGLGIIGLLSNSYFAYDIFNSLWANLLFLALLSMLFITAFVQEIIASRAVVDVITNTAIFIVGLIFVILYYVWADIFIFGMVVLSAIMVIVLSCRCVLTIRRDPQNKKFPIDFKQVIAVVCLLMFALRQQMTIKHVDDGYVAWSLIPAAVACAVCTVVAFVLLRRVWAEIYPTKVKRVCNAILAFISIFFVAFLYSFVSIGVINWAFDGEPQQIEFTVLDKNVRSGARTPTEFEVKVIIDGKEKWIPVPVTDYHEITEGDVIIVNYHTGALHFAYYSYSGLALPQD